MKIELLLAWEDWVALHGDTPPRGNSGHRLNKLMDAIDNLLPPTER